MKVIVILVLFANVYAKPATLEERLDRFETIEDIPDLNLDALTREKKAPALVQIRDNAPETDEQHNTKEKSVLGTKKPIIVKKKVGYRVYRDSDEELTQADPKEMCKNQVKVKLCEDGTESIVSHKREPDSTLDMTSKHMSETEMKQSIQMAKEAVEHLQSDLQMMRSAPANQENPLLAQSKTQLHKDIEVARQVLEHIHSKFGNLQSIGLHAATLNSEDLGSIERKRMAQWKEATSQDNTLTLKNIEDRFRNDNLNNQDEKIEQMFDKVNENHQKVRNSADMVDKDMDTTPSCKKERDGLDTEEKRVERQLANDKLKNIQTDSENEDSDLEISMVQDIQPKMTLQSENLTKQPGMVTSSVKDKTSDHETSTMDTKESEIKDVKTSEKEHDNRHSSDMRVNNENSNILETKQNGMELMSANKMVDSINTKNEQLRFIGATDNLNEVSVMNEKHNQPKNNDQTFDHPVTREEMIQQRFSDSLNSNFANENIAQTLNNFKSADTSEQHPVSQLAFNGLLEHGRTHETDELASSKTTPATLEQDVPRMNVASGDSIASKQSTAFHTTEDQSHAASERMDMRWAQEMSGHEKLRNNDLSQHALIVNAPVNEPFNLVSMRNSHTSHGFNSGPINSDIHEHRMTNNRFTPEFGKEQRFKADEMRSDMSTHAQHGRARPHAHHLTSETSPSHGMFLKSSHTDSAIQASNNMDVMARAAAEYQQWFNTRVMSRGSSYTQPQNYAPPSNYGSAVGLFPNAKTGGCAIPLLVSCSPSVVSGTLAKEQSYTAPSYTSSDNYRYHNKRDTKSGDEKLVMKPDQTKKLVSKKTKNTLQ